jgi:hypothetical protein
MLLLRPFIELSFMMSKLGGVAWFLHGGRRKAMASLLMMVSRAICQESNARTFRIKSTVPVFVFNSIMLDTKSRSLAGAKHLGLIMPQE